MKQRAADAFPVVLAALLPVVGLILALARYAEGNRPEAVRLGVATAVGLVLYALLLAA